MLSVCCDYCGKPISKLSSKQKGYRHHFCNGKCYGRWKSEYQISIGYWKKEANPSYGKRLTKAAKQLISERVTEALKDPEWRAAQSARGKQNMQNPNYVTKLCDATRKLWQNPRYRAKVIAGVKEAMTEEGKGKRREATKRMWQDPEYRRKVIANVAKALNKKPNKQEERLEAILSQYFPRMYEYTGDGKLIIGGMIPDFANCNGKKDLIEFFGDYWHSPEVKERWKDGELGKIMAYNSLGYRCLVIWEHELKDEQAVVAKVKQFMKRRS